MFGRAVHVGTMTEISFTDQSQKPIQNTRQALQSRLPQPPARKPKGAVPGPANGMKKNTRGVEVCLSCKALSPANEQAVKTMTCTDQVCAHCGGYGQMHRNVTRIQTVPDSDLAQRRTRNKRKPK